MTLYTYVRGICALLATASLGGCSSSGPLPFALHLSPSVRQESSATGAHHYAIATQGISATAAAAEMFEAGGNIIDAAVAASFALAVERPQSTGIGGGGFLLYFEARTRKVHILDFRERAPGAATERMFLKPDGSVNEETYAHGPLSAGTPGLVRGLEAVHQRLGGRLAWAQTLRPAITLAERGFPVYAHLAQASREEHATLAKVPASQALFLKPNGPLEVGDLLIQRDLGRSLRAIADRGARAFYDPRDPSGIAQAILSYSKSHGGILKPSDFEKYKVRTLEPVRGQFLGYEIVSMPPPSSGGTHVIQILSVLNEPTLFSGSNSDPAFIHRAAFGMQHAFVDRATYLGDPDFVRVPTEELTNPATTRRWLQKFDAHRALRAGEVHGTEVPRPEKPETTHFSILDAEGNAVVSTQTINGYFGSGDVVPGTGIVLNNQMNDFSAKPGSQNIFGAVGGTPNRIEPYKTPLSSMSPTLVLENGRVRMGLGAPGGTRILTCVAQTVWQHLGFRHPLLESIASLRFHHQWKPDELLIEASGTSEWPRPSLAGLTRLGYPIRTGAVNCRVNAVARLPDGLAAATDPRDIGTALGR